MMAATRVRSAVVDPTQGSIPRALVRLTLPMMTGGISMVIYQLLNTLWLGRSGSEAVAAVAMAFPFLMFFYGVGDGMVFGASALVARYTGAGQHDRVSKVSGHAGLLVACYYLLVALVVIPLLPRLLALAGAPPEIVADALVFLQINLVILPFSEMFFVYSNMLQAMGNCVTPMKMWGATMIAAMLLDPLLIVGVNGVAGMGVLGAAISVAVTRVGIGLVTIRSLRRGMHGLRIGLEHIKPDPEILRAIFRISLPIMGERLLMGAEQLTLVSIVARFGSPVLAAYGVGSRLLALTIMPAFSAGTAVNALVGQNLGAGRIGRAFRGTWVSLGLVFLLLSALGITLALAAPALVPLFNTEPQVLELGVQFCRILGPLAGFTGLFFVLGGAYRAADRTLPFMIWSIVLSWGLRIPLALLLPTFFDVAGIWYAMAAAGTLATLGAAGWLYLGHWRKVDPALLVDDPDAG